MTIELRKKRKKSYRFRDEKTPTSQRVTACLEHFEAGWSLDVCLQRAGLSHGSKWHREALNDERFQKILEMSRQIGRQRRFGFISTAVKALDDSTKSSTPTQ